ncbi:RecQ family ATP-dependent DNA helicase [Bacillus smithii]|uniref:RecQ family ATP-dependent DNA helicase n=1 Tax=Bacillus smithii TaxID=1479 RepID=UPI0022E81007|nr:ATP-dependent DNA helicase RecQ [Bacillus smithii]
MELELLLRKQFGYSSFRTGQKEVITSLLEGKDTLAMLPTGTGKSLCYQLPAYILDGTCIIISPLLSLMQDQMEQMKMRGEKRVIALNSFLSFEEKKRALSRLGQFRFVFMSPEMLSNQRVLHELSKIRLSLFVVDEAHCISQWGHDFRPDYLKIGEARELLNRPLTLALTATATEEVRTDIMKYLHLQDANQWIFSVDRANIAMSVQHCESYKEKLDSLLVIVKNVQKPGIIYFSSKKAAEETAYWLEQEGIKKVGVYHGGMEQDERILIQQQFLFNELEIICATSAFGMGINKNDIRFVVHFHPPGQMESYLQEIGRAGRDGKRSLAILLYADGDERIHERLMETELPTDKQIEAFLTYEPNLKKEAAAVLQLTDVQYRYLLHYEELYKDFSFEKKWEYIQRDKNEQIRKKRRKLSQMVQWIHSTSCRREGVLLYFHEKIGSKPERCCDCCGLNILDYYESTAGQSRQEEMNDWEAILQNLLLMEGKIDEKE